MTPPLSPVNDDTKGDIVEMEEARAAAGDTPVTLMDHESNQKGSHSKRHLDDATVLLQAAGESIQYTTAESRRVLRKIDLWVCVPMCIIYTIQNMDKQTLSYSAVFDLQGETHLVGTQYSWLTSAVYCIQLVAQPLSSYALVVFPVKYWVMFNYFAWSACLTCLAAAHNFTGLLIGRILLGGFEATILPAFILISQMWWTRREQSYRTVAYLIANSIASIIGPILAYGIGHATQTIHAYQAIFLSLGAISLGIQPLVWFMLPNSPATAKFLRHGNDRLIAVERLRENNTGTKTSKWKWHQFREAMRDLKTWGWTLMMICTTLPAGAIGSFGGLITQGFGFNSFQTILMQIPTGVIGIITLLSGIYLTNRFKMRYPGLLMPSLHCRCNRAHPPGIQPLLFAWANLNAAGTTKRVVTTASMFGGSCIGNIVGPQLYFSREAPTYHTGLYCDIAAWSLLCVLCVAMGFHLRHLNNKQAKRRMDLGLSIDIQDMSIMSLEEASAYRLALTQQLRQHGFDEAKLYEHSFDDMTDFE
ncbi:hypothetical protein EHS25_001861 [Saitozyma podzolica]|uniref:Major facilitator superfamily (MFS) profile domain-containing protein n=1 Tax=Saitozyma podzolica TaxID=1890683 RepID=A0A427YFB6_9TREE|nr:hypothetical protein EHS25_001861 [Saitozyma podzolica]